MKGDISFVSHIDQEKRLYNLRTFILEFIAISAYINTHITMAPTLGLTGYIHWIRCALRWIYITKKNPQTDQEKPSLGPEGITTRMDLTGPCGTSVLKINTRKKDTLPRTRNIHIVKIVTSVTSIEPVIQFTSIELHVFIINIGWRSASTVR